MKHILCKRLVAGILLLIQICALYACNENPSQGSELNIPEPSVGLEAEAPTHFYEVVTDNITIDASVSPLPEGATPAVYEGAVPELNKETLDAFLSAVGDSVTNVLEDSYADELKIWSYVYQSEKGAYAGCSTRVGSQDVTTFSFSYTHPDASWIFNALNYYDKYDAVQNPGLGNNELFLEQKTFSFATEQEALTEALRILEILGIHNAVLSETLYLDHETLAIEERSDRVLDKSAAKGVEPEFKPQWTEADDAYFFSFDIEHEGILVQSRLETTRDTIYIPTRVQVIYNQSGVISLNITQPWVFSATSETTESILSLEEATEKVKEILLYSYVPHERIVDELNLRYYYRQDGDRVYLRPCWIASVLELQVQAMFNGELVGDPYDRYSFIIIDAITGQEL